jgi:hypothetical protein
MSEKHTFEEMPDDLKEGFRFAFEQAKNDSERYSNWIKDEIEKAIGLIEKFDKIYVLGGLGAGLIKSIRNQADYFSETVEKHKQEELNDDISTPNDDIEVLLEYAMSLASANVNLNKGVLPSQENINEIYKQLLKIKFNSNFLEMSAVNSDGNGIDSDSWLRMSVISDTLNVRGNAYQQHIMEIYHEIFESHNEFLQRFYGFDTNDLLDTVIKLDKLVHSKIGNAFGAKLAHERFVEWSNETNDKAIAEETKKSGKHFMQQFTEDNPDLADELAPNGIVVHRLDRVEGYNKVFWVIPKSEKEKLIFDKLSIGFGDNNDFLEPPKFKGFPMNTTLITTKPLIKENEKHFHFSMSLAFRNIFKIAEDLIRSADTVYFENSFRGNSNASSKDNFIELKTKNLFQKLLPLTKFYHSLEYEVTENGMVKRTELDILGISSDTLYIIEIKAGELNPKHRRGAIKGLKDRLKETINEGSYQCHRARKYISEQTSPIFEYVEDGTRKTLTIDKSKVMSIFKISVTFEHFSAIAANLRYLIDSNVLSEDFKWTWIVSIFDLMVFADIIENEEDFKNYLQNRLALYDRNDIEFSDEIDILGYFLEGNFPIKETKPNEFIIFAHDWRAKITEFYQKSLFGIRCEKPKRFRSVRTSMA